MYARYTKQRVNGKEHFHLAERVSLFGCNEGFIPWLLRKSIPHSQREPYRWHLCIGAELENTEYPGSALVVDLKPKQKQTNLSLYEVLNVYGYSDHGWTPILLHLSGLFVDVDPTMVDRNCFSVEDEERDEPIFEFLYLAGSVSGGKLTGKWIAPPASPTNAALLWPEPLEYFNQCIQRQQNSGAQSRIVSNMEIHRAANLGLMQQKLGIDPDARITYRLTEHGVVIWDLATEKQYTVTQGNPNPSVARFQLPQKVKDIVSASDDQLKKRWAESWIDGWSEERETIFTELAYRGISTLGL